MFTRSRIAMGFALAAILLTSITTFAKGGFDFIMIAGPGLKETLRVNDISFTEGFFTFANFYEDKTRAPVDPGEGYEITRHYAQGTGDIVFDRLHYYPETGFVFYDGIENGDSEYDGEWYIANPEIKQLFESALTVQSGSAVEVQVEKKQPVTSQLQLDEAFAQAKPVPSGFPSLPIVITLFAAGLAALCASVFWRRKASPR